MTNIEHLFETGLNLMKKKSPDEWKKSMAKNINWTNDIGMTLDELWLLCQYTIYTYSWDLAEVKRCEDCEHYDEKTAFCDFNNGVFEPDGFCSYGKKKGETE